MAVVQPNMAAAHADTVIDHVVVRADGKVIPEDADKDASPDGKQFDD
jgi:hypothetical protein